MSDTANTATTDGNEDKSRRDFLVLGTAAVGGVGTAVGVWPFIHSLNPAADTLAMSTTEVDIEPIEEGQSITVVWQGKPVFIRHRTAEEISIAKETNQADLIDPQTDDERVQKAEWLIMVGVCTHLGCIPLGQKQGENRGDFNGWFCPCHGSHYDTSGRIRKGPAPKNLVVPKYEFVTDTTVKIG